MFIKKKKGIYSKKKKKAQRTVGEAGEKAPLPRVAHLKERKEPELFEQKKKKIRKKDFDSNLVLIRWRSHVFQCKGSQKKRRKRDG